LTIPGGDAGARSRVRLGAVVRVNEDIKGERLFKIAIAGSGDERRRIVDRDHFFGIENLHETGHVFDQRTEHLLATGALFFGFLDLGNVAKGREQLVDAAIRVAQQRAGGRYPVCLASLWADEAVLANVDPSARDQLADVVDDFLPVVRVDRSAYQGIFRSCSGSQEI